MGEGRLLPVRAGSQKEALLHRTNHGEGLKKMLTNLSAEGQFRPVGGFAEPVVREIVQRNRDTLAGIRTQIHRHLLVFVLVANLLYLLDQHCVAVNASNQRKIAFAALRRDDDVQRRDVFRRRERRLLAQPGY